MIRYKSSSPSITYSLSGSLNDLNTFEIESDTGAIYLVSKLNRSLKPVYHLTLVAHSLAAMPSASTTAELNIVIAEDETTPRAPPTFTQPFYEFLVTESSTAALGRVRAFTDLLPSSYNRISDIEYGIDSSRSNIPGEMPFRIDSRDGRIFVTDSKRVAKSIRSVYEFYVTARHVPIGSSSSSTTMTTRTSSPPSSIVKVKIRVN